MLRGMRWHTPDISYQGRGSWAPAQTTLHIVTTLGDLNPYCALCHSYCYTVVYCHLQCRFVFSVTTLHSGSLPTNGFPGAQAIQKTLPGICMHRSVSYKLAIQKVNVLLTYAYTQSLWREDSMGSNMVRKGGVANVGLGASEERTTHVFIWMTPLT